MLGDGVLVSTAIRPSGALGAGRRVNVGHCSDLPRFHRRKQVIRGDSGKRTPAAGGRGLNRPSGAEQKEVARTWQRAKCRHGRRVNRFARAICTSRCHTTLWTRQRDATEYLDFGRSHRLQNRVCDCRASASYGVKPASFPTHSAVTSTASGLAHRDDKSSSSKADDEPAIRRKSLGGTGFEPVTSTV